MCLGMYLQITVKVDLMKHRCNFTIYHAGRFPSAGTAGSAASRAEARGCSILNGVWGVVFKILVSSVIELLGQIT